jgi:Bacterial regulatory protein, Fis family
MHRSPPSGISRAILAYCRPTAASAASACLPPCPSRPMKKTSPREPCRSRTIFHGASSFEERSRSTRSARAAPHRLDRDRGHQHPRLHALALRDLHERKCIQYALTGKERLGKGPLVLLLDRSGSMEAGQSKASRMLGISRGSLQRKLAKRPPAWKHWVPQIVAVAHIRVEDPCPSDIGSDNWEQAALCGKWR